MKIDSYVDGKQIASWLLEGSGGDGGNGKLTLTGDGEFYQSSEWCYCSMTPETGESAVNFCDGESGSRIEFRITKFGIRRSYFLIDDLGPTPLMADYPLSMQAD